MNFLYKKTISNMQLVVDIESDYVRATVLVGDIETPMQVVFSTNTEIIRKAHTDGLYLTRNMLSALAKTMQSVSSAIAQSRELFQKSRPDSITIILSSPWVISRLVCVKQLFETNVEINHSMISKMIEDEKDKNNQIFANGDSEVIEHVFFDVKINGYPVTNYQGTSGRSLEGTLVTSFGPRGLLSEITSGVNRFFRAKNEKFHSSTLLRYIALKKIFSQINNYVWIEIHGGLTDINIISDKSCACIGSIPHGYDKVMNKYTVLSGSSESSAKSAVIMSKRGDYIENTHIKTVRAMEKSTADWLHDLELFLKDRVQLQSTTVYVSAKDYNDLFIAALKKRYPDVLFVSANTEIVRPFLNISTTTGEIGLTAGLHISALPEIRIL